MSSTTSSVGGSSPGKSISGRVGWVLTGQGPLSVGGEDVDDEDEGVVARDLRRTAGGAVAVRRRDDEEESAPDRLPLEAVVPALDDLTLADRELEVRLLRTARAGVEHAAVLVQGAGVGHPHGLAL